LLVLKALEWGSPAQRSAVQCALGRPGATEEQLAAARQALVETGALRYCRERADKLAAEARCALVADELTPDAKSFLLALVDFMVDRER
jgi:geranylgeranyl pyrophosphate synthase